MSREIKTVVLNLKQLNIRVWILKRRQAPVGVDRDVRFCLEFRLEIDKLNSVGELELLEHNPNLDWVRASAVAVEYEGLHDACTTPICKDDKDYAGLMNVVGRIE